MKYRHIQAPFVQHNPPNPLTFAVHFTIIRKTVKSSTKWRRKFWDKNVDDSI